MIRIGLGLGLGFGTGGGGPAYFADFVNRIYSGAEASVLSFARSTTALYPRDILPLSSYATNTPRFDSGLVVEPTRKNWTLNPKGTGATIGVVGSGGINPTGWGNNVAVVREIVSQSTDQGMSYTRYKLSRSTGTPSSSAPSIQLCGGGGVNPTGPWLGGQCWLRIVSKSANITSIRLLINAGGISSSGDGGQLPFDIASTAWQRGAVLRQAFATGARLDLAFDITTGTPTTDNFDVTVDIGYHQMEDVPNTAAASFSSLTSIYDTGSGTRGAEVATITAPSRTYDRLAITGLTSATAVATWTDDLVVSGGGDILPDPATIIASKHRHAAYFPAGISADRKNQYLDAALPSEWSSNLVYASYPVIGETVSPQSAQAAWSIKKATNRAYQMRFELRQGDFPPAIDGADGGGKDRCEMSGATNITHGTEYWFAFDIRFELLPDTITTTYFIVCQLHDTTDAATDTIGAPPPFEIGLTPSGNKWSIDINGSSQNPLVSFGAITTETVFTGADRVVPGRTYRFVVAAKEGYDGTGRLRAWLDGVAVCDVQNRIIGYNNLVGSYIKFGLYRGTHPSTVASIVSNFTESASSLLGRVTDPLPQ